MEFTVQSLLAMVIAGGVATYIWRFAGTVAVQALDPAMAGKDLQEDH